jgi:hypothetical protein
VSHPYGGQPATGYGDAGATSYVPTAETNQAQYLDDAQPMTADGHPDVEGTSVGTLISEVTRDLSTLMRQEVELAKAEIRADANKATAEVKAQGGKAGKGAGMLVGAGYGGHMLVLFLSLALMFALGSAIPLGWAALIVAVIWGIVAAVLGLSGRKQLKTISFAGLKNINPKPEQTVETLQQVPGALKPH